MTYKAGNPNEIACGMWARGDAGRYDIDSSSGLTLVGSGSLGDFASKQRLSYQGGQVGLDCATLNMQGSGWNGHVGITGGQISGDIEQLNGIGKTDLDVPFGGVYGFLTNGSVTFDLTVRRDFNNLKITNTEAGLLKRDVDGDGTTVAGVALYRADLGGGLFVAPNAGMTWTRYELDDFRINSGGILGTISAGSDESLVGRLGVQVSYVQQISPNNYLVPFGGISVWQNFENTTDLALTFDDTGNGTSTILADTTGPSTFKEYSAGLSYSNPQLGVTGFVKGAWRHGADIDGGSVTGGGRVNF